MSLNPTIEWCSDQGRTKELATFFAANVSPSYISHSELQGPRALSPIEWRPDLPAILEAEIRPRLALSPDSNPFGESKPILTAHLGGELVGLSFVTFDRSPKNVSYIIIEDLIVAPARRGSYIGTKIIDWIIAEAKARHIGRAFLESGTANHRAHDLFEKVGFEVCSKVFMKTL